MGGVKMKSAYMAATLYLVCAAVFAADVGGVEITGYSRGGGVKGGLTLGGDLQKYRLGNEGDAGIEVNMAKSLEVDGVKYTLDYMPTKWNGSNVGTEQAFVEMSGLGIAPEAKIWVGQRRLRIQDVHIVDHFLMDYGVNQGSGFTDLSIAGMKLGAALQTGDSFDSKMLTGTSANKLNLDLSAIHTNTGGQLRILLTSVSTSGLKSSGGFGFSLSHNQSDFMTKGLIHTLFLQTSSGYANINGRFGTFYDTNGVDSVYGKKVNRIADAINWQFGAFGGQALFGYQTTRSEDPAASYTIKDSSLGGRVSYAVSQHFKWLMEVGTTSRKFSDSQAAQRLNKITIAPTLALSPDFWSRPELRFYVTRANWNEAAAAANSNAITGFGANARTSQTLAGVQYEVWW